MYMISKIKEFWSKIGKTGDKEPLGPVNVSMTDNDTDNKQATVATTKNSTVLETARIDGANDSIKAKKKQDMIMWAILGVVLLSLIVWIKYKSSSALSDVDKDNKQPFKLEVASEALDSEKMWRNYFEDKLVDSSSKAQDKIQLLESAINEQSANYQNEVKSELEKLRQQVQLLTEEQILAKRELETAALKFRSDAADKNGPADHLFADSKFTINDFDRNEKFDYPKSSRSFIPETAYVKGILLGGISVSTSIGSSSEPVPVVIRITDRGNLPKDFMVDLKHCRIMGSSYGDLSSERAIVRAEVLSCSNKDGELIHTTKVAGIVFGDDGMNGIKGKVIQTSNKHLQNAFIGSMLSGFAQSAKGQDQFIISSLGSIRTKKRGAEDMLKSGAFAGVSNAAERVADYYIKQAEAMSPVLLVSGGTKVDIVFTKGVYFGSLDVQDKLEQLRGDKGKE